MSEPEPKVLSVIYALDVLRELDVIAEWNEKMYGRAHARKYIKNLERQIESLGMSYAAGNHVTDRPDLRYVRIRRRNRGHGHVVVYHIDDHTVNVLHIFHTSQDWENKLHSNP